MHLLITTRRVFKKFHVVCYHVIIICFVIGAYDHWLKVWDARSQGSVLSMDHGSPVESVQIFPTGGICVSAGE